MNYIKSKTVRIDVLFVVENKSIIFLGDFYQYANVTFLKVKNDFE